MGVEAVTSFVAHTRWGQTIAITSSPVLTAPAVSLPNFAEVDIVADIEVVANNYEPGLGVTMEVEVTGKNGPYLIANFETSGNSATGGGTDLTISRDGTSVTVLSSTGADVAIPAANGSNAGVMTAADFTKLAGIAAGAQVNPTAAAIVSAIDAELGSADWQEGAAAAACNLSVTRDATTVTVASSTGTDAILPAADTDNAGLMTADQFDKLAGIEAGADDNYTLSEALGIYAVGFGLAGNWIDQPTLSVTSNGTTISAAVGAANFITSDGVGAYAGSTISLQAGTSTVPVLNYIYVLESDLTLYYSTSGFPTADLHVPVAIVLCQSAVNVQADGVYNIIRFDNHTTSVAEMGAAAHFYMAAQQDEPIWISGLIASHAITTNGGSLDDIDVSITSGAVRRGKRVAMSARDTAATDSVYIANSSAAAYTKTANLGTPLLTAAGGGTAVDGDYVVIVMWASIADTETASKLFINVPTNFYKTEADARADAKGYAVYQPPAALKNSAVLLSRRIFRYTSANSGTWTHIASYDLRGAKPSYFLTSVVQSKEHLTSDFRLRDGTDVTKQVAFANSGNTTGTTRTVTVPDASGTLSYLDVAQSFAAGAKKTFSHSGTTAGVRVAPVAGDPSAPEDGDLWYNLTTNKFRKRQNGVTEDMDIASSSAAGGDDNEFQYNNGGAFEGAVGFTYDEANDRPVLPNGGQIAIPATYPTDSPTTDTVVVSASTRRGPPKLSLVDHRGHVAHPMPHLLDKQIGLTTVISSGAAFTITGTLGNTSTGTLAGVATATTSLRDSVPRIRYTSNATPSDSGTANGIAGARQALRDAYRGNGTIAGGFYLSTMWSLHTTSTNWRGSPCNMTTNNSGPVGNVAMSSLTNFIGFIWDSTQTNYRAYSAGASAGTPIDLGSNFPINTTDLFRGHIWCVGNDTEVYYLLENLTTGNSVSGAFNNTELPSTTTPLGYNVHVNNGGDSVSVAIEIARIYLERSLASPV